jgi:hypothetical protein
MRGRPEQHDGRMRAMSLTQPWAGLVVAGIKPDENRDTKIVRPVDFGRPFAIHATREIDYLIYDRIREIAPELWLGWNLDEPATWPAWYRLSRITSALIGVATIDREAVIFQGHLFDVHRKERVHAAAERRFAFGPVIYMLSGARALPRPIGCRGFMGFWRLKPDKESAVRDQLGALL